MRKEWDEIFARIKVNIIKNTIFFWKWNDFHEKYSPSICALLFSLCMCSIFSFAYFFFSIDDISICMCIHMFVHLSSLNSKCMLANNMIWMHMGVLCLYFRNKHNKMLYKMNTHMFGVFTPKALSIFRPI